MAIGDRRQQENESTKTTTKEKTVMVRSSSSHNPLEEVITTQCLHFFKLHPTFDLTCTRTKHGPEQQWCELWDRGLLRLCFFIIPIHQQRVQEVFGRCRHCSFPKSCPTENYRLEERWSLSFQCRYTECLLGGDLVWVKEAVFSYWADSWSWIQYHYWTTNLWRSPWVLHDY